MWYLTWIFWVGVGLIIIFEIIEFKINNGETISEITWRVVRTHPIVPFLAGVLMGHLFWQSSLIYSGLCK